MVKKIMPLDIPASFLIWKDGDIYRHRAAFDTGLDYANTDAATVIQDAFDAASPGDVIVIKPGTYETTGRIKASNWGTLRVEKELHIYGYGATIHNTQHATETDEYTIVVERKDASGYDGSKSSIHGLRLTFTGTTELGGGIWVGPARTQGGSGDTDLVSNVTIKDVKMVGSDSPGDVTPSFGKYGVYFGSIAAKCQAVNCEFDGIPVPMITGGVDATDFSYDNDFINCRAVSGIIGYQDNSAFPVRTKVVGCIIDNFEFGARLRAEVTFDACKFRTITTRMIDSQTGSPKLSLRNCEATDLQGHGVYGNWSKLIMTGNDLDGSSSGAGEYAVYFGSTGTHAKIENNQLINWGDREFFFTAGYTGIEIRNNKLTSGTDNTTAASYVVSKVGPNYYAHGEGKLTYSGTNAATVINNALSNLTAGRTHKEKVVLKGAFTVSAQITPASYTILECQGTITVADGVNNHIVDVNGKTDVELRGLHINGNSANQTAGAGVRVRGASARVWVEDCYLNDCYSQGILVEDNGTNAPTDIFIKNNHVNTTNATNGSHGIALSGAGLGLKRVVISGNIVYDPRQGGINVSGSEQVTVTGNNCELSGASGQIYAGIRVTNSSVNVTISGNTCKDGQRGIFVTSSSEDVSITGNTVKDSEHHGILCEVNNATISANVVVNSGKTTGNAGIRLGNVTGNVVTGNRCYDDQTPKTQTYGVEEGASADNNTIVANDVRGNLTAGLKINGTSTVATRNLGYLSEVSLLSGTFAIDSTGLKTIATAHGMTGAPTVTQCQASIAVDTAVYDWTYNYFAVVSADATNVTVRVNVNTASATGGATAKIALRITKHS